MEKPPSFLHRRTIRSALRGALSYIFGRRGQRRVQGLRMYFRLRSLLMLSPEQAVQRIAGTADTRLWVDREVFPRIRKLLSRAQHTIVIQMFIWKDDEVGRQMAQVLVRQADRGVRVFILKEAVGDFFEAEGDFLGTKNDSSEQWQRFWHHPNIRIDHATHHDHSKVYIIDGTVMLLTGMNIATEYAEAWHDYLVELRGMHFVDAYLTRGEAGSTSKVIHLVMNTEARKEIRPVVMGLLRGAKSKLVLEQCYLSDPDVERELIACTHRGVDTTIILPERNDIQIHRNANMLAVSHLLTESDPRHLRVFLYPGLVHGKIILADRKRAFIGSANLITSSLDEMGEVNVLIEGGASSAVRKLREVLRDDVFKSRPMLGPPTLYWLNRLLALLHL